MMLIFRKAKTKVAKNSSGAAAFKVSFFFINAAFVAPGLQAHPGFRVLKISKKKIIAKQ